MLGSNNTGNIISELRREAGYTQKSLACVLNITDKAVSKWERGICLPDVALLPKLSRLLGAEIELLLAKENKDFAGSWIGLLDLRESMVDLSQVIYDKPMVYYMLSHFLLLGIKDIYVWTTPQNKKYLQMPFFRTLGFSFVFDCTELPSRGAVIMNKPYFFFGADLTRLSQSAMVSGTITKSRLTSLQVPFIFCPPEYSFMYLKNPKYLYEIATDKNYGRGMICIEMGTPGSNEDASAFVRMYQDNMGLLIGSLEEIAFRKALIDKATLGILLEGKSYKDVLLNCLYADAGLLS